MKTEKLSKKLVLNKTTINNLNNDSLEHIKGGILIKTIITCPSGDNTWCNSWDMETCPSNPPACTVLSPCY